MDVLDELGDLHGTLVVSERDRVAREAGLSRVSVFGGYITIVDAPVLQSRRSGPAGTLRW